MGRQNSYTEAEIAFIRLSFIEFGPKQLSLCMNRNVDSISQKAKSLGLRYIGEIYNIGQQFGKLTILNIIQENNIVLRKYRCKCSCGKIKVVEHYKLSSGNTKSCGCLKKEHASRKIGEIAGLFFTRYKWSAISTGKQFNLTKEYLSDLFEKQNRKCALTGEDINIVFGNKSKGSTASIDKIDSSKGYLIGNVQFVHKDVNKMKMDFDQKYFIKMCGKIYKYNTKVKNEN